MTCALTGEVKQNIAQFFQSCTSENVRWRQNVKRKLEVAAGSAEFINLSRLALSYAHGLPGKMQPEGTKRESLVFLTTNGMVPWDPRADSMSEITSRMLAQKAEEEKLHLEAAKRPEPVAATDNDSEAPVESLELVEPPPQPADFNPRGSRRLWHPRTTFRLERCVVGTASSVVQAPSASTSVWLSARRRSPRSSRRGRRRPRA